MAQTAYDLQRFETHRAPAEAKPRIKVAKSPKKRQSAYFWRMARLMAVCVVVVALVCSVLSSQAMLAEVQADISRRSTQVSEAQGLNDYLTGQLNEIVNLRTIDQRAAELGLVQIDNSKINYIRVEDGNSIEVRQGALQGVLQNLQNSFLSIFQPGE